MSGIHFMTPDRNKSTPWGVVQLIKSQILRAKLHQITRHIYRVTNILSSSTSGYPEFQDFPGGKNARTYEISAYTNEYETFTIKRNNGKKAN